MDKGLESTLSREETDLKAAGFHVEEVTVARLTEDDMFTLAKESLTLRSKAGFRIFLILLVMGFNQAAYGVDWGVVGNVDAFQDWHTYYNFGTSGSTYGVINALMTIGIFVGSPLLSLQDVIGRRGINFVGNALVIVGSLMQAFANNIACLMAARFILGLGAGMMSSSQYMAEICPHHMRGRLVGIFGACFQLGSLATGAAMLGLVTIPGHWSWRAAFILQAFFPLLVCATIYLLCPESPRFLMMRGNEQKARKVVAAYHTNREDNLNHPLVNATIAQIKDSLAHETSGHRQYWDYSVFLTKPVRYRLLVLVLYSCFQQWNGGGVFSYYTTPMLQTLGINDSQAQIGINLGLTAVYFVFTLVGAFLIDVFRRRTLIFSGLISFVLLQTATTISAWQYELHGSKAAGALAITWMFVYQCCSASLIATMHNLYPVEVVSLALRAKGMGLYGMVQGIAGTVQTYGISVGIDKIGYKIWVVYIAYNFLQLIAAYFIFPETSGLSLEEIDAVFETKGVHPVKMSMEIEKAKKEMTRLDNEVRAGVSS